MYGFDGETGLPMDGTELPDYITSPMLPNVAEIDGNKIRKAMDDVNASRESKEQIPFAPWEVTFESVPSECVYISIDDIGVKHQKEFRKEGSVINYKYVENTVAHIQYGEETYVLTGIGMSNIFKSVLAFLLANNLLSHELVFLTDGAKDIKSHIEAVFQFHPYIVILDWFHLKKRCQEWLSMAIRGKKKRNAILKKLLRLLWVGNVSGALDALQMIYLNYQSDLWFRKKELYRLSELCNIGKVA